MINKKLLISSALMTALISGCVSLDGSVPKISTTKANTYGINSFLRQSLVEGYTLKDYEKVWGKPTVVVKNSQNYIVKWEPYQNSCTIHMKIDPATNKMYELQYHLSDECASVQMTGAEIDVPVRQGFYNGYMAMRDRTRSDSMADNIGKNIDTILINGSPNSTSNLNSGGKVYTWKSSWQTRPNVWSGEYYYGVCEASYVTNRNGTIVNWAYSGCNPDTRFGTLPAAVPVPQPKR